MLVHIRLRWDKESIKAMLDYYRNRCILQNKALRAILCSLVLVLYYMGMSSILNQSYVNNRKP